VPRSSDAPLRLFFALWPERAARESLDESTRAAVTEVVADGGRAIAPENWHVTLCFLGEQPAELLPRLSNVAATIRVRPLSLTLTHLEHWRESTVLCATHEPHGEQGVAVAELAQQLASALDAAGISHDNKAFRAHLTLARKVEMLPRARMSPVTLAFDRFVLVASRPGRNGSIYSVVDSWHLYIE
jgi:RNA 2',3'-cyclic 3'-phosphodiesterase